MGSRSVTHNWMRKGGLSVEVRRAKQQPGVGWEGVSGGRFSRALILGARGLEGILGCR